MYPEAGPSRPFPYSRPPPNGPGYRGPPRRDDPPPPRSERDDRPNGFGRPQFSNTPNGRPRSPARGPYRPPMGLSRTPSPPRRRVRDPREDRDERQGWGEYNRSFEARERAARSVRESWTNRRDDTVPPPLRVADRPSPSAPASRYLPPQHSPPTGPRSLTGPSPPFPSQARIPSGPRIPPERDERSPWEARDRNRPQSAREARPFDRPPPLNPSPRRPLQQLSTRSSPDPATPREPRSMRGTSSPETRMFANSRAIANKGIKTEPGEEDLEEGEVLSPTKSDRPRWYSERAPSMPARQERWVPPRREYRRPSSPRAAPTPRRVASGEEPLRNGASPPKRPRALSARPSTPPGFPLSPILDTKRHLLDDLQSSNQNKVTIHRSEALAASDAVQMDDIERPVSPAEAPPPDSQHLTITIPPPRDSRRASSVPLSATSRPATPAFPPPEYVRSSSTPPKDVPVQDVEPRPVLSTPNDLNATSSLLLSGTNEQRQMPMPMHDEAVRTGIDIKEALSTVSDAVVGAAPEVAVQGTARFPPKSPTPDTPTAELEVPEEQTTAEQSTLTPAPPPPVESLDVSVTEAPSVSPVIDQVITEVRVETEMSLDMHSDALEGVETKALAAEDTTSDTAALPNGVETSETPARPVSPLSRRTIAERRAVQLPPTPQPLSSPFVGKALKGSLATFDSGQESSDLETELRIVAIDSDFAPEEALAPDQGLLAVIRKGEIGTPNVDGVFEWNAAAAPKIIARVDSPGPWVIHEDSDETPQLDSLANLLLKQEGLRKERDSENASEYLRLYEAWRSTCQRLTAMMEARGPAPQDLFDYPPPDDDELQPLAPLATPITEEVSRGRGGRALRGEYINSEAQLNAVLALSAEEVANDPEERARHAAAIIPDMLPFDGYRLQYDDDNDLVLDPMEMYDFADVRAPIWTDSERETFRRKFISNSQAGNAKNFGKIAEAIPDKTAPECVQFYYSTKKEVDYKRLRVGGAKRAVPEGKKSAKSLLGDLNAQKPAAKPGANVAGKSVITPARRPTTPAVKVAEQADTPAPAEKDKEKPRSRPGPKRRRVSTTPDVRAIEIGPAGPVGEAVPVEPGSPTRRSGKKRRTATAPSSATADGAPVLAGETAATPVSDKPRRPGTNSYWSVEEKKKVDELIGVHRNDYRAIAVGLGGAKSEKQVANFIRASAKKQMAAEYRGHMTPQVDEIRLSQTEPSLASGSPIATAPRTGRSIYNVHPLDRASQPRMGVFPSAVSTAPVAPSPPNQVESPIRTVSRPGGMNIASLLNDDSPQPSKTQAAPTGDADSDATDDDDTVPKQQLDASGPPPQRPDLDRYRSSTTSAFYDKPNTSWSEKYYPSGPPRAATVGPPAHTHPQAGQPYMSSYPNAHQSWQSNASHDPPVARSQTQPPMGVFNGPYRSQADRPYVPPANPYGEWRSYPPPQHSQHGQRPLSHAHVNGTGTSLPPIHPNSGYPASTTIPPQQSPSVREGERERDPPLAPQGNVRNS